MIEKTVALATRIAPFGRTSQVVTWLTPDHGKVVTAVKGARRPKSPFLGQCDLFYTCELLFYSRNREALNIAREYAPLDTRSGLRGDWKACLSASYACDLTTRVSQRGHAQPEIYSLLVLFLDHLGRGGVPLHLVFWFELKLLGLLGFAPRLARCSACDGPLNVKTRSSAPFSCTRGGVLCPNCACAGGPPGGSTVRVAPGTLAMLRNWQVSHSLRAARNTRCSPKHCLELRDLLGIFIQYHLDIMPAGRNIAVEILRKGR